MMETIRQNSIGRSDKMPFWSKSRRTRFADISTYVSLTLLSFIIMIPVIWMLSTALKKSSEVFLFPPIWIPSKPQWANFILGPKAIKFSYLLKNTVIITTLAILGQLIASPLTAFSFAVLRARAKESIFMLVLSTMMLPTYVTMIPRFLIYRELGWVNTLLPLTVWNFFGSAFFIFLLRQFFLTIPMEMGESARIDGCGYFRVYTSIYLPMSKPALATVAIFTFMDNWNDFVTPLIYLNSTEKWTLTLGLSRFVGMYGMTEWNLLMATTLVTVLPCIILYFFAQKYFIQGIVISGVKG